MQHGSSGDLISRMDHRVALQSLVAVRFLVRPSRRREQLGGPARRRKLKQSRTQRRPCPGQWHRSTLAAFASRDFLGNDRGHYPGRGGRCATPRRDPDDPALRNRDRVDRRSR